VLIDVQDKEHGGSLGVLEDHAGRESQLSTAGIHDGKEARRKVALSCSCSSARHASVADENDKC